MFTLSHPRACSDAHIRKAHCFSKQITSFAILPAAPKHLSRLPREILPKVKYCFYTPICRMEMRWKCRERKSGAGFYSARDAVDPLSTTPSLWCSEEFSARATAAWFDKIELNSAHKHSSNSLLMSVKKSPHAARAGLAQFIIILLNTLLNLIAKVPSARRSRRQKCICIHAL